MQEDGVGLVSVETAPRLISDVERWQDTAPIKQQGVTAVVVEGVAGSVRGLGAGR